MAEVSDITFSGFKLRLSHENGLFSAGTLPNSYPPDPNAPVTQLGEPFPLDASGSGTATERLAASVGDAFGTGGVANAKMLGIRLVGKFIKEHPDVVPQ